VITPPHAEWLRETGPEFPSLWQAWQARLAALSPQGQLIIADKSGHFVHHDQPKLVIDAIQQVVEATRQKR
jgi:pimeloyl-ACP methyl ester carboxylesterase